MSESLKSSRSIAWCAWRWQLGQSATTWAGWSGPPSESRRVWCGSRYGLPRSETNGADA